MRCVAARASPGKVGEDEVQPRGSQAGDGLGELGAQSVGRHSSGASSQAQKQPVQLAERNTRDGLHPCEDPEAEE